MTIRPPLYDLGKLEALPTEIREKVFHFCDLGSLQNFAAVSRAGYGLIRSLVISNQRAQLDGYIYRIASRLIPDHPLIPQLQAIQSKISTYDPTQNLLALRNFLLETREALHQILLGYTDEEFYALCDIDGPVFFGKASENLAIRRYAHSSSGISRVGSLQRLSSFLLSRGRVETAIHLLQNEHGMDWFSSTTPDFKDRYNEGLQQRVTELIQSHQLVDAALFLNFMASSTHQIHCTWIRNVSLMNHILDMEKSGDFLAMLQIIRQDVEKFRHFVACFYHDNELTPFYIGSAPLSHYIGSRTVENALQHSDSELLNQMFTSIVRILFVYGDGFNANRSQMATALNTTHWITDSKIRDGWYQKIYDRLDPLDDGSLDVARLIEDAVIRDSFVTRVIDDLVNARLVSRLSSAVGSLSSQESRSICLDRLYRIYVQKPGYDQERRAIGQLMLENSQS